jgi:hypothetical protein
MDNATNMETAKRLITGVFRKNDELREIRNKEVILEIKQEIERLKTDMTR